MNGDKPTPMPSKWVVAMIADWMAASVQYTGSLNMIKWLDKNMGETPTMPLHRLTNCLISSVLGRLGYVDNWDNAPLWAWLDRDWAKGLLQRSWRM